MTGEEQLDRLGRARVVRQRMFDAAGTTPLRAEAPVVPVRDSLAERVRDRIPPVLRGVGPFGAAHLSALLVTVALVLLLLAWWVVRSGPRGEAIPPPPPVSMVGASVTPLAPSAPSQTPAAEVVVDVAGKVRHPGVYHLPDGSRVVDALEAAGGARKGVDLSQVNLARVLTDGEQILLVRSAGRSARTGSGNAAGPSEGPVNINRADRSMLETLPGVGPVTASAIVSWRERNGPFASVDDLVEVSGIGTVTLERLRPYVTV